jgi:hypothetical protein
MSRATAVVLPFLAAILAGAICKASRADVDANDERSSRCVALRSADLSQELDALIQVVDATWRKSAANLPEHCDVTGYVSSTVGFDIKLPSPTNWNKKLFQLGCGGFCGGADNISDCDHVLRLGYACITSDNGHKSTGIDAKWAFNNLVAEIDHAFRAPHVTALAGQAIVRRYYDQSPRRVYFMGSSTGGRQALMAAQRFPWDFDGIIAGAPSINVPLIYMHLIWANRALVDRLGIPRLTANDIETLHRAVLAKCDLDDGLEDELILDPRTCSFDPSELLCTSSRRTACLSTEKVASVKKLYSGPVTSAGEQIYMTGVMKGSERTWLSYFWGGQTGDPWAMFNFAGDAFRYSGFSPAPGPKWSPNDFDFDRDFKRLGQSEALYAATNPDLRRFKARGGKLIAYVGWADAVGMPLPMIDYYETAERTLGGRRATQDFFRLFVVPGMTHGPDANGAIVVDWVSYLEAWVEQGQAPDKVQSVGLQFGPDERFDWERLTGASNSGMPDPSLVRFGRPVYPYPTVAVYSGQGDPNVATSFRPAHSATDNGEGR